MPNFSRRQLLVFFGSSAAAAALEPVVSHKLFGGGNATVAEAASLTFTPVRLPHPLPIYQQKGSFLATGFGQGSTLPPSPVPNLAAFSPIDDVVVPPEYERYVIASWGDRIFPNNKEDYFGYNCDYTGFVSIDGRNDGYLVVNHEYNSFPISPFAPEAPPDVASFASTGPIVIDEFPTARGLALSGEFMYNMGASVIRIARDGRKERFAVVVKDPKNRRIHGLSGLGINSQRSDAYNSVTSWGSKSYQTGDENYLIATGPAASEVFEGINSDGLGNKIIGTAYNCSGGNTPWGTVLSAEENFQASTGAFFVGVQESVKPDGTQTGYATGTTGADFGLVGEKYGWMVEIDPARPKYRPRKHTALGRYRHENIAMRVEAGKKLVAYLGDDRRGGHTWKFVSKGKVKDPQSKGSSKLLENGILYVAKYNADGTGSWLPLLLSSPTDPVKPSELTAGDPLKLRSGSTRFPRRVGIAGQTTDGGSVVVALRQLTDATTGAVTALAESDALPDYQGKTLSDFYTSQGAVLVDAFLAANLIGGTPTARPEDIEINPRNAREVIIAYTDGAPGGDGYPDSRIFVVGKYDAAVNDTQQSGGLYKIIEDSADSTGTTFRWERFAQGGEAGAEEGAGFAAVDNLVFDNRANIWCVTDMSTTTHNGFATGAAGTSNTINHTRTGDVSALTGVFGNNWLFYIPTTGADAGKVVPFAYGPVRCEITGPTFVGDTLIVAVQHPGEDCPFTPNTTLSRTIEMLALDGTLFDQTRTVSRGSNWPSNIQGQADGPPKPSVIGIRRKRSQGQFV